MTVLRREDVQSEGASWGRSQLRTARLALIVEEISDARVHFRVEGFAHLGSRRTVTVASPFGVVKRHAVSVPPDTLPPRRVQPRRCAAHDTSR